MLTELTRITRSKTPAAVLTRSSAATLALRASGAGLSMVVGLVLAAVLGADGYGTYVYSVTWLGFATTAATLGMDQVLVRYAAAYQRTGRAGRLRGLLRFTQAAGLLASACILLPALAGVRASPGLAPALRDTLTIILCLLPVAVSTVLRQSALRGFQQVVLGQLPETLVQPILILVLVAAGRALFSRPSTAPQMALVHAAAVAAAFAVGFALQRRLQPPGLGRERREYERRAWLSMGAPLVVIAGLQVLLNKGDILLLGTLTGAREAGVYAVASRVADMVLMIFDATSLVGAPMIAGAYAAGDRLELQRIVSSIGRLNFWLTAPICITLFALAPWVLGLFGEEFVRGASALRLLVVCQFFSASAGAVGQILYMTGHQRDVVIGMGACALLNIALALALIPRSGAIGAAVGAGVSITLFKVALSACVYRRLRIASSLVDLAKLGRLAGRLFRRPGGD